MSPAQPRPSGPGDSPGFLLWQATRRWQRALTAALRPLELTHVQFVLLAGAWWLGKTDGVPPTQRRLGEHAGTDPMMTSQVVRALEARALLARALDPGDARARRLTVTPSGRRLAQRAIGVVEEADAAFFARADSAALLPTLAALATDDM